MSILVINAGSSSVKYALFGFDSLDPVARGLLDFTSQTHRALISLETQDGPALRRGIEVRDYRGGIVAALELLRQAGVLNQRDAVGVIGHRLIHGGEDLRQPVRITAQVIATIARSKHLAPLHIPAGLDAISATQEAFPGVAQVGLFDTAFFANIPPAAYIYPLPYQWYEQWGIRRYGFHGISHAYCTMRAAEMLERDPTELNVVICHLGQGASATAVRNGAAIDNTMGFTPLEGLVMGTRSGSVDPGILLYVMREKGMKPEQLDEVLHKQSGLAGIAGMSGDYRQIQAAAARGDRRAQLGLDIYAYRVKTTIGALAVTLGRLDALVFTGGIGENASAMRAAVCSELSLIGLEIDGDRNTAAQGDADVATEQSRGRILVIHSREDLMIARECKRLMLNEP